MTSIILNSLGKQLTELVSKYDLQGIKIDNLISNYKALEKENETLKIENSDLREKLAAAQEQIRLAHVQLEHVQLLYIQHSHVQYVPELMMFDAANQEPQSDDYAQVAAWLEKEARAGRLKIIRTWTDGDGGRIARHHVFLMEEKDGEMVIKADIGGQCLMEKFLELHQRYSSWLGNADEIVKGYWRIKVMIRDSIPDHIMFKRSDGSPIDLGMNDYHFHLITVDIPKQDFCIHTW